MLQNPVSPRAERVLNTVVSKPPLVKGQGCGESWIFGANFPLLGNLHHSKCTFFFSPRADLVTHLATVGTLVAHTCLNTHPGKGTRAGAGHTQLSGPPPPHPITRCRPTHAGQSARPQRWPGTRGAPGSKPLGCSGSLFRPLPNLQGCQPSREA